MTAGGPVVRVSVVLSDRGREEAGRALVTEYLGARSLEQTGGGVTTLSFAAKPEALVDAFGPEADSGAATVRPPDAVGGGGAFRAPDFRIPQELKLFVEAISVTPPARRFGSDD